MQFTYHLYNSYFSTVNHRCLEKPAQGISFRGFRLGCISCGQLKDQESEISAAPTTVGGSAEEDKKNL